jgi:phosphate transport system substrate-binding protein
VAWLRRRGPAGEGGASRSLLVRLLVYTLILMVLFVWRVLPGLRAHFPGGSPTPANDRALVLTGGALAPDLAARLIAHYRELYPLIDVHLRGGGTRQALEELINGDADVAFLSREPTAAETAAIRAAGDSAMTFPIALGGIAVLTSKRTDIDSLAVDAIRELARGAGPAAGSRVRGRRLYATEPNSGLWTALTAQLGLPDAPPSTLAWVGADSDVVDAVARDASGLGFASTLDLPADLEARGVKALWVYQGERGARGTDARSLAAGDYPLIHYFYVSCRPSSGALASGFVTYYYSGQGQRLIAREGFLPAREVGRDIILTRKPLGERS